MEIYQDNDTIQPLHEKKQPDMEFIAHRVNTLQKLTSLDKRWGAETDLRDTTAGIVLHHDPFPENAEKLEEFLACYRSTSTLILNVKSEGVEFRAMEILGRYAIPSWFFLDSSFAMIYKMSCMGFTNHALRYSRFESLETLALMRGRARWVWVDFLGSPVDDPYALSRIREMDYRICIASPGITGSAHEINSYIAWLKSISFSPDAVCAGTDEYTMWVEAGF